MEKVPEIRWCWVRLPPSVGTYLAINGGLPADAVQDVNTAGAAIGLHSYYYKRDSGYVFRKPVARHEPDYVYFIALETGDIVVTVTRNYDDATSDFYNAMTIAVVAGKTYWLRQAMINLRLLN